MADDITNIVLLQHMQKMKSDLEQQIAKQGIGLENLTREVRGGFAEVHQHLQALQEDLEATMEVQSKHQTKLARL